MHGLGQDLCRATKWGPTQCRGQFLKKTGRRAMGILKGFRALPPSRKNISTYFIFKLIPTFTRFFLAFIFKKDLFNEINLKSRNLKCLQVQREGLSFPRRCVRKCCLQNGALAVFTPGV